MENQEKFEGQEGQVEEKKIKKFYFCDSNEQFIKMDGHPILLHLRHDSPYYYPSETIKTILSLKKDQKNCLIEAQELKGKNGQTVGHTVGLFRLHVIFDGEKFIEDPEKDNSNIVTFS